MASRNIDERFRKPRRAKGTPFYSQRNYLTLGVVGLSGLSWILFELWPQTKILKQSIKEGKFEDPPALRERFAQMQIAVAGHPELGATLAKVRDRIEAKADGVQQVEEEDGKPKPWYIKMFTSTPDL